MIPPDRPRTLLLDGPTGTELQRRGFDTSLPLWSARALLEAPELVRDIHMEYIRAGADVITTNSFRTNRRVIERAGMPGERAEELTRLSVEIAREAREACGRPDVLIAGSDAPVEDCYTPDLVPTPSELEVEHAEHLRWLADAGCDILLIETMNTLREATAAAQAAAGFSLPFWISLVTDPDGVNILSGESLREAVVELNRFGPAAILTNCSAPRAVRHATELLADARTSLDAEWAFGGYPNSGEPDPVLGWEFVHTVPVEEFCTEIGSMVEQGAGIVGSCCGTGPGYIERFREVLGRTP